MSPAGICGERRSTTALPRWARTWNRRAVVQLPSRLVTAWFAGILTGAESVCVRFITVVPPEAGSDRAASVSVFSTEYPQLTIQCQLSPSPGSDGPLGAGPGGLIGAVTG